MSTTDIVFVSASEHAAPNIDDGVYRSFDNGDTWELVFSDPFGVGGYFYHALNPINHLYVGHFDGIDYSDNNGNSFTYLGPGPNYLAAEFVVNQYGRIFGDIGGGMMMLYIHMWRME